MISTVPPSPNLRHAGIAAMRVQRCDNEQNPYGTGIALSPKEDAADLNTVIAVNTVHMVGTPSGLRPTGYLFRIATGAYYYQPQFAAYLSRAEIEATLAYLETPGTLVRPSAPARVRELVESPIRSIFPVNYSTMAFHRANLVVSGCTPRAI